jgi:DNA-binding protein HU-beta
MVGKGDLAQQVAQKTGMPRTQATKAVDALIESVQGAIAKREEVRITGFGSWRVTETKARKGRNPRTGAALQIKAGHRVSFRPGSKLSEAVKGGRAAGGRGRR